MTEPATTATEWLARIRAGRPVMDRAGLTAAVRAYLDRAGPPAPAPIMNLTSATVVCSQPATTLSSISKSRVVGFFPVMLCPRRGCVVLSVFEERVAEARKIERTIVQGSARLCNPAFGRVCKALWPIKTAEELASRIGCAVRTAAYEISGEREPSSRSVAAVVFEITRRPNEL